MCGINGIIDLYKASEHINTINKMNNLLKHRGPDGNGVWNDENIAIGHTRLSILDLTKSGHQPMLSNDLNYVISYNGEIYNFKELRQKLVNDGFTFNGNSDTEVILKYFENFGIESLKFFEGMFAFAIWDRIKKCLYIARDRIGEKPCYYNYCNQKFIFSSEIKGILAAPWFKRKINKQALANLSIFPSAPDNLSIYDGINSVPPGHFLKFSLGKVEIKKYWQLKFKNIRTNCIDILDEFSHLMKEKILNSTSSDVPIGLALSGGIDSSFIGSQLVENNFKKLSSYCITSNEGHERSRAENVAKIFNFKHKNFNYEINNLRVSEVIKFFDEPVINGAFFYSDFLMKSISKHVKVCLTGNGADEIFAGYNTYSDLDVPRIPFINYFFKDPFQSKLSFASHYFSLPFHKRRGIYYKKLAYQNFNKYFTKSFLKNIDFEYPSKIIDSASLECNARDFLDTHLYTDLMICHRHGHCVIPDRSGMRFGLELRSPFLNHKIIEFASRIPNNFKIRSFLLKKIRKYIIKKSLKRYLPKELIFMNKLGFGYDLNKKIGNFLDLSKNSNLKKLIKSGDYNSEKIFNQDFLNNVFKHGNVYERMYISLIAIWYETCIAKKKIEI